MIARPSCAQLIEVVRRELIDTIAVAVADPTLAARLDMMDSVLRHVETRCEGEVHWMRCEIAEIEQLAVAIAETGDGLPLRAALAELRANRATTDLNADVRADYDRASELLSCCLDVLIGSTTPLRDRAIGLMNARLDRELEIRGIFETAGRR